jgi:PAS domain S-box-containing protein
MDEKLGSISLRWGFGRYRLTCIFAVTSVLAIVVITLVVNSIYGKLHESNLTTQIEGQVVRDALHIQAMARARWPMTLESLAGPKGIPGNFPHLIEGLNIVKFNLFNLAGKTVWSTDPPTLGVSKQESPLFRKAAAGGIASKLARQHEVVHLDGVHRRIDVVETYVPIRVIPSGQITGVMEIYRDVTDDVSTMIQARKWMIIWATLVPMSGLFLVLLVFIVVADVIIDRTNRQERLLIEHRIAERQRKEKALCEAYTQTEQLLTSILSILIGIDTNGRITRWNETAERVFGIASVDAIGQLLSACDIPWERPKVLEAIANCRHTGELVCVDDLRCQFLNGQEGFLGISINQLQGPFEEQTGFLLLGADITARKQAEAGLKIRSQQQEVVAKLSQRALAGTELSALMDAIVALVTRTLDVEYSNILELLPDRHTLLLRAGVGWKEGYVGCATVDAGGASQAGYTLLSDEPVVVDDLHTETRFAGSLLLHDHGVVSGMSVIIQGALQPFGILSVHTTKRRTFTRDDIHFLRAVANVLAVAVERTRTEEALRESEERYRDLVENSEDLICTHDLQGVLLSANRTMVWCLGYERVEEILGRRVGDFLAPDVRHLFDAYLDTMVQDGHAHGVMKILTRNGEERILEYRNSLRAEGSEPIVRGMAHDITERKRAEEQLKILSRAVEQSPSLVLITDTNGNIEYVNPKFTAVTGYTFQEAQGQNPRLLKSGETSPETYQQLWDTITEGGDWRGEFHNKKKDGGYYWASACISPIKDEARGITHFVGVQEDITARKHLEHQLLQTQKLEAIGQLAAGIAHEINTPTQFVGDNLHFLQEAFTDLDTLLTHYASLGQACQANTSLAPLLQQVEATAKAIDVDYLLGEIPSALQQSLEGVQRVATIVHAMKDFAHPGSQDKTAIDLNQAIASTITVARNEWKYVAEIKIDFDPELPLVLCILGAVNQAILNLLINAAQAIGDIVGDGAQGKGVITLRTRQVGAWAEIRITDTGPGIPAAIRDKIFEPFFTTKPLGQGTGQGLAIAYDVIVRKHGGTLGYETDEGQGTTFVVRLPLGEPGLLHEKA